jgi:holliday junction DNA helicase RuvA
MGEAARSRATGSRAAERPAMDGRAGRSGSLCVAPRMAAAFGREREVDVIGRLKGTLIHKQPPWLVLDVHGVGYELEAPMSTIYDLPDVGREVMLFTHYAQKEDSVSLYGFLRESERRLFRDVQKVSGIGAKIALAVLSGASVDEFARLIQTADVTALTRIPGIGKKTAERMVVELRDRAADFATGGGAPIAGMPADAQSEAVSALQQLGYKPAEAARMARDAAAVGDDVAAIIRKALQSALR